MIRLVYELLIHPVWISVVGWGFILSHYMLSYIFVTNSKKDGPSSELSRNSAIDIITSVLWGVIAICLIISLIDLISRQEVTLLFLLNSYLLLIFLFAYLYNVIEWHYPGTFQGARSGLEFHVQCVILSAEALSGGASERMGTSSLKVLTILTVQRLIGLLYVAVFIARAVGVMEK